MPDSHDIALSWRKSSASASSDCVEVALSSDSVLVRDSKERRASVLEFTASEWRAFISGVRAGEFDIENLNAPGVA
jgi:hypothetical protein